MFVFYCDHVTVNSSKVKIPLHLFNTIVEQKAHKMCQPQLSLFKTPHTLF